MVFHRSRHSNVEEATRLREIHANPTTLGPADGGFSVMLMPVEVIDDMHSGHAANERGKSSERLKIRDATDQLRSPGFHGFTQRWSGAPTKVGVVAQTPGPFRS